MAAVLDGDAVHQSVGIDTFGVEYGGTGKGSSIHILERFKTELHRLLIIQSDSHYVLPLLSGKFDLIYIDGDHSAEGCRQDLEDCLHLLPPRGIILVDDIDNPNHSYLLQVVESFVAKHGLEFDHHRIGPGLAEIYG